MNRIYINMKYILRHQRLSASATSCTYKPASHCQWRSFVKKLQKVARLKENLGGSSKKISAPPKGNPLHIEASSSLQRLQR